MIEKIEFRSLGFDFFSQAKPQSLFADISFCFPTDCGVWLKTETAGQGRSTLLRILALLLEPSQGDYLINSVSTQSLSFEESVALRRSIGFGFDIGGLLSNRSLKQNLMLMPMYHKIWSPIEAEEQALDWLRRFDLLKQADLLPSSVTGGQRKIVTLIRALMLGPEMLVLDEPSLGLNSSAREILISEITTARAQKKLRHLFLATSDKELAQKITEQDILLYPDKLQRTERGESWESDHAS